MSGRLAKAEGVPGDVGRERRLESLHPTSYFAGGVRASTANEAIAMGRIDVAEMFKVVCHQQPRGADGAKHLQPQGPPQLLGRDRGPPGRGAENAEVLGT
jgi:hypothetical protein